MQFDPEEIYIYVILLFLHVMKNGKYIWLSWVYEKDEEIIIVFSSFKMTKSIEIINAYIRVKNRKMGKIVF